MASDLWNWESYGIPERIYQITYTQSDGRYSYPQHSHRNQWELLYASRGRLRHSVGSRAIELREGTFSLVRESDSHSLQGSGFSFYNLAFPNTLWEGLGSALFPGGRNELEGLRLQGEPPTVELAGEERAAFEEELDRLLGAYDPLLFLGLWARAVGFCLRIRQAEGIAGGQMLRVGPDGERSVPPAWLARALVEARSARALPALGDFVAACGRSPEHVARSVRRYWNRTPTELLLDLRMERALSLLAQTNQTVGEIAQAVGFPSLNYFHRLFRRRQGCTPLEYRRGIPRPHRGSAAR